MASRPLQIKAVGLFIKLFAILVVKSLAIEISPKLLRFLALKIALLLAVKSAV